MSEFGHTQQYLHQYAKMSLFRNGEFINLPYMVESKTGREILPRRRDEPRRRGVFVCVLQSGEGH